MKLTTNELKILIIITQSNIFKYPNKSSKPKELLYYNKGRKKSSKSSYLFDNKCLTFLPKKMTKTSHIKPREPKVMQALVDSFG